MVIVGGRQIANLRYPYRWVVSMHPNLPRFIQQHVFFWCQIAGRDGEVCQSLLCISLHITKSLSM
jgi:hypothetical protein